jgi:MIP family channel proteins
MSLSEHAVQKLMPALVGEFIGTFGLCFIGILAIHSLSNVPGGLLGIALAHGLMLAIAVTAFMNISGGHINPAVTVGLMVGGKISPIHALAYIVAQCLGGLLAGLLTLAIFAGASQGNPGQIVVDGTPAIQREALRPAVDLNVVKPSQVVKSTEKPTPAAMERPLVISPLGAMLAEAVTTFFLLIAVWGTAVDPRAPKVGGFAIGLTVGVDILAIGVLTGGAINPARAFGPALATLFTSAHYDWANHWVYWVGPILGGVVASLIYKAFIYPRPDTTEVR